MHLAKHQQKLILVIFQQLNRDLVTKCNRIWDWNQRKVGRPTKTIIRRWAAENYNSFRRNYTSLNNWRKISVRPFPSDDSCRVLDTPTDPELVPVSQKGSVRQSIIFLIQRQRCLSSCTTQETDHRDGEEWRNSSSNYQQLTIDCHHFGPRLMPPLMPFSLPREVA